MHAQDIIDYVENHSREEGDAYLDSLFDSRNFFKQKPQFDDYGYPDKYVVKDKICLTKPDALHFPYGGWDIEAILLEKGYYPKDNPEKEKTLKSIEEMMPSNPKHFSCDWKPFIQKFQNSGLDISGVEILLKICDYNNQHKESDIVDRLLEAAHKNGVTWCDEIVKDKDNPYFYINTLCKHYGQKSFRTEETYSVSGRDFKEDLKAITKLYEFAKYRTHDDAFSYGLLQPIRDSAREHLFEAIAQGKTSYDYNDLKEFYDASLKDKTGIITRGIQGSDNNAWSDDETNVLETDAYKRAMRRIEYDILKHENKEIFEAKDFGKLPEEQKDLILEFTDSKDVAQAIVDSYKGNVEYNELIAKHFTKDEFEQIVEDYKITQYRRENEQLRKEHEDVLKEKEALAKEKEEFSKVVLYEKESIAQERVNMERTIDRAKAKVKSALNENALQNDIRAVCQGEQYVVDRFEPVRKKEIFDKMQEEITKNPNLLENHLVGMCKIYVSKTNTPEEKAVYFEQLHKIRKSGNTNAEKREMARTFGRVLERNPDLAKDEALKGLAKIDYSAVGYTPTTRGFSKNSKSDLEK